MKIKALLSLVLTALVYLELAYSQSSVGIGLQILELDSDHDGVPDHLDFLFGNYSSFQSSTISFFNMSVNNSFDISSLVKINFLLSVINGLMEIGTLKSPM